MKTARTEEGHSFSATFTWVNQDGTNDTLTVDGPTWDKMYRLALCTPLAVQDEISKGRWVVETVSLGQLADCRWAGGKVFLSIEEANQYITDQTHEKETAR